MLPNLRGIIVRGNLTQDESDEELQDEVRAIKHFLIDITPANGYWMEVQTYECECCDNQVAMVAMKWESGDESYEVDDSVGNSTICPKSEDEDKEAIQGQIQEVMENGLGLVFAVLDDRSTVLLGNISEDRPFGLLRAREDVTKFVMERF